MALPLLFSSPACPLAFARSSLTKKTSHASLRTPSFQSPSRYLGPTKSFAQELLEAPAVGSGLSYTERAVGFTDAWRGNTSLILMRSTSCRQGGGWKGEGLHSPRQR